MPKKIPAAQKAYQKLIELSSNVYTLHSIQNLLMWDQETFMPKMGLESRSHQMATLASFIHKEKNSRKFTKALQSLIDIDTGKINRRGLSAFQKAVLREWRKDYRLANKLPNSFIKNFSQLTSSATQIWSVAKKENDFKSFAPTLEKIVDFARKKADYLGYDHHPYDALIDLFEPGMNTAKLHDLFYQLEKGLSKILTQILAKPTIDDSFLYTHFERDKQILFGNQILDILNIDRDRARLDESIHPFSISLHPNDVRMTTRIEPNNFISNIFSILHETGHSLYELGLPVKFFGTPLCEAVSLGIHESQSRWWETLIGRSESFWKHFYPLCQRFFDKQLGNISLEEFYKAINAVKPSLIRVEADEVTYCLHIILRFNLELALIEGSLSVVELPEAWRAKMQDLLHVTPSSDSEGCLQDIHWSTGEFGYFPTYALGNLYASQFFQRFAKDEPQWKKKVVHGELVFIQEWLREHIHKYGRFFQPEELCIRTTGSTLSEKPYLDYLSKKYKKIYNF